MPGVYSNASIINAIRINAIIINAIIINAIIINITNIINHNKHNLSSRLAIRLAKRGGPPGPPFAHHHTPPSGGDSTLGPGPPWALVSMF